MAERRPNPWWATVGGALGGWLALRGGRWDALVAGWGGGGDALAAGVALLLSVTGATIAGVVVGAVVARALGAGRPRSASGAALVIIGGGVALAALPRFTGGDVGWAIVGALALLFTGPALALAPWAGRR